MSPSLPADAAARAQALDVRRSYIVSAPAGSGKTGLLTQRFLALLATVRQPEQVVAITFTRKAAAEMSRRILQALDEAQQDSNDEFLRKTRKLARAVLAADERGGWHLRRNPGRLRVLTIDALCAELTRQMPVLSFFGAQPSILDETEADRLYLEAAVQTVQSLAPDQPGSQAAGRLLEHLDNDVMSVAQLCADMLKCRDQWLHPVVGHRLDRAALQDALSSAIVDGLQTVAAAFPVEQRDELLALARYGASNLIAKQNGNSELRLWQDRQSLPGAQLADLPAWLELRALLLKADGKLRQAVTMAIGFPPPSRAPKAEKTERQEHKDRMLALLGRLADYPELVDALAALSRLPPPQYDDRQWLALEALSELLPLCVARLELLFRSAGKVDFVEMARGAVRALGDPEQPTELALKLDYRIQHLLVDEFQDTSLTQFRLLERLTAGWTVDDGRTLFLVGDPMQSIYRFREAEVGLFLRACQFGVGTVHTEPVELGVNFRSSGQIIDWVNHTFTRVLPSASNLRLGAIAYTPCRAHHEVSTGLAVQWRSFVGIDQRAEAGAVAQLAATELAADDHRTVAILVRARSHLNYIVPALNARGLTFKAVDIEQLSERPVVRHLLAIARALCHQADRIAWLALLRDPWCGLTLADLHALARVDGDRHATVWELLHDEQRLAALSDDGRRRVTKFEQIMSVALAERGRRPLRSWVEATWLSLGGPAAVDEAGLQQAEAFFTLLDHHQTNAGLLDLGHLEAELEHLFAPPDPEADPRLQIMTIHKAKGLEFDTVILPGLGRKPQSSSNKLLSWLQRPASPTDAPFLLAPIKGAHEKTDPIVEYVKSVEQQKERFEQGRLLYVATTRARRRLWLVAQVKTPKDEKQPEPQKASLLELLWPSQREHFLAVAERLEDPTDAADPAVVELATDRSGPAPLTRLRVDWLPPTVPASIEPLPSQDREPDEQREISFDWAGETVRLVGIVVHRFMRVIAREGLEQWGVSRIRAADPLFRAQLLRLGLAPSSLDEALRSVKLALQQTTTDERGRWILSSHAEAQDEYALCCLDQGRVRRIVIDRTFVDEQGIRWIVDYKTSRHSGGDLASFFDNEQQRYRDQLERYADAMARFDERSIRLGLYFPLMGGWRQWEP